MKTIYKAEDILNDKFQSVIRMASFIWQIEMKDFVDKNSPIEWEACVINPGFYVLYLPKKCKKPIKFTIVVPMGQQRSTVWDATKNVVASYLKNCGIDAEYDFGYVD